MYICINKQKQTENIGNPYSHATYSICGACKKPNELHELNVAVRLPIANHKMNK